MKREKGEYRKLEKGGIRVSWILQARDGATTKKVYEMVKGKRMISWNLNLMFWLMRNWVSL